MTSKEKKLADRENELWDAYGADAIEDWPDYAREELKQVTEARDALWGKRWARRQRRKEKRLAAGKEWLE